MLKPCSLFCNKAYSIPEPVIPSALTQNATVIKVPNDIVNNEGSIFDGSDKWYEVLEIHVDEDEWESIKRFVGNTESIVALLYENNDYNISFECLMKEIKKGCYENASMYMAYCAKLKKEEIFKNLLCSDGMIIRNTKLFKIVAQMQSKDGKNYYKIWSNRMIQISYEFYIDYTVPSFSGQSGIGLSGFKRLIDYNNKLKEVRRNYLVYAMVDRSMDSYMNRDNRSTEILPGLFQVKSVDNKEKGLGTGVWHSHLELESDDQFPYMEFYEKLLIQEALDNKES